MEMCCELVESSAEDAAPQSLQDARVLEELIQHRGSLPARTGWPPENLRLC